MAYNPSDNVHQQAVPINQMEGQTEGKPYQFSASEIRVLRECNKESFYYRCIPLSFLFSGLAHIGVKQGYLSKSVKYGSVPKMLYGVVIGYFAGKFSYANECREKIMRLPNSKLGEAMRRKRGLASIYDDHSMNEPSYSVGDDRQSENWKQSLSADRSPDLSEHSDGLESYNKVTEDLNPYSETGGPEGQKYLSYEELRKRNREQYEKLTGSSPPQRSGSVMRPDTPQPTRLSESTPKSSLPKALNKYGDAWDE